MGEGSMIARMVMALLLAAPAQGATLAEAQTAGWVPAWLDASDPYRALERKEGTTYFVYHCFEDSATGSQWTLRTRRGVERDVREGRAPVNLAKPKTAATAAQKAVCFTAPPPPPPGPRAVGEPAYWSLTWKPGTATASTIDFTTTNLPANIAGASVAGEACGLPAKTLGYYTLPRLQSDGRTPLVRCE